MNHEKFTAIVVNQLDACKDTLVDKAKEYAIGDDRLYQFKVAAALQSCTPVRALVGMMVKHTTCIYDLCAAHDKGNKSSMVLWNEKITDQINYLLLLKATLCETEEVE